MSKKIVVVHKLLDPELAEKIIEKGSELGYRVEYYKSVEEALPAPTPRSFTEEIPPL